VQKIALEDALAGHIKPALEKSRYPSGKWLFAMEFGDLSADQILTGLVIGEAGSLKDALQSENHKLPDPLEVDTAGVQLLAAAIRSGVDVPEEILSAPGVQRLWRDLALDEIVPLPGRT
jgi:hypothetical protein